MDVQQKRSDFLASVENISPHDMIFIDESGANLAMTTNYGRAEGGQRVKAPKPFNIGMNFSVIGAISLLGIIAIMYIESAVDTNIFSVFVKKLLLSKLKPGQFVIFDNVKFHKAKEIKDLIESRGAKVVFLPPYSPDLSPIEKMWAKIKETLKKMMPRTEPQFHDALVKSLFNVSDDDFEEWYDCCGYSLGM
jgi:transposase